MSSNLDTEESLRREAEQRLTCKPTPLPPEACEDPQRLIHELRVHQIELEMQNELLTETLASVNALRAKYQDLYDFAPVGYFTLGPGGDIVELNLRAAQLLGRERERLVGLGLRAFFDPAALPAFDSLLSRARPGEPEAVAPSLQVMRPRLMPMYVNAQAQGFVDVASGQPLTRLALMDVTALKSATDDVVHVLQQKADTALGGKTTSSAAQPFGARS
jgi:PAS domain S-box-containing protein